MAPTYAASALLLLALPHAFAAPTNAEAPATDVPAIVPPILNTFAPLAPAPPVGIDLPSPEPAPVEVSPFTGGVLTSPDIIEEPFPLDPGIGDGTIPAGIPPIPIEPGIGDGSGPEAFGDSELPDIALPTGAITTIIDVILSDPVPSGLDPPVPSLATDPPIPEIIKDPLLLPPDEQTATNAIVPPQTLDVESFLSIVQQLADVISGFFTIQPGRPAPPVGIVPDAILSSIAAVATAVPVASAASILPILPIDKVTTVFNDLKKRDLSVEQHHLLSEVASKNFELQNAIDSLRKLHVAHLEKRDSSVNHSPDTQAITSRVTEILKLIDRVLDPSSEGVAVANTAKAVPRGETLPVGELLNNFGGLGGPPNIARPIIDAAKPSSSLSAALSDATGKVSNASSAILFNVKPAADISVPGNPFALVQQLLAIVEKLIPFATGDAKSSPVKRSAVVSAYESPAKPKPKPASLSSIYDGLANLLSPAEAAKALQAAFDALSPASQAMVLLSLGPGPVIPDLKLTKPQQVNKRSTQDIYKTVREFIKNWHTIGVSLGEQDPKFVAELMSVFHDPNINPKKFDKLGKYPEKVRKFVQQYYILAQVLLDAGVSSEDKVDLLKLLFDDDSQAASRRTNTKRDDGRQWDEKKVKDFIKLFWQADPLVQSLSDDSRNQLGAPFTSGSKSKVHSTNKIQYAAIQWTKFRDLLNSLGEEDKQALTKLLQEGQLVPEKQKRSMRHGLRRRQYGSKHTKPDLGAELDNLPKLGAKLDKILGPSGTLDPMGMTDPYPADAKTPYYDTDSNHVKSNPKAGKSEYDPESDDYIGDYEDADDAAADFWDPYNQIDAHADEYANVPGGAPENWK